MTTRNISIPDEVDARLRALSREEMPSFSGLITRLLVRELDRLDAARARRAQKSNA
jgi:predicted CopG family antitoxin